MSVSSSTAVTNCGDIENCIVRYKFLYKRVLHHGQKAAIKLGRDVGTLENLWQLTALDDGAAIG